MLDVEEVLEVEEVLDVEEVLEVDEVELVEGVLDVLDVDEVELVDDVEDDAARNQVSFKRRMASINIKMGAYQRYKYFHICLPNTNHRCYSHISAHSLTARLWYSTSSSPGKLTTTVSVGVRGPVGLNVYTPSSDGST